MIKIVFQCPIIKNNNRVSDLTGHWAPSSERRPAEGQRAKIFFKKNVQ